MWEMELLRFSTKTLLCSIFQFTDSIMATFTLDLMEKQLILERDQEEGSIFTTLLMSRKTSLLLETKSIFLLLKA